MLRARVALLNVQMRQEGTVLKESRAGPIQIHMETCGINPSVGKETSDKLLGRGIPRGSVVSSAPPCMAQKLMVAYMRSVWEGEGRRRIISSIPRPGLVAESGKALLR